MEFVTVEVSANRSKGYSCFLSVVKFNTINSSNVATQNVNANMDRPPKNHK